MLDTCGFLSLSGLSKKRLSAATLGLFEGAETVYISACSLFEIAIKHKKGNINVHPFGNAMELWEKAVEEYQLVVLPVSAEIFFDSTKLPDHHGDPFDRIIIAESLSRNITVVTYDAAFGRYAMETIN
jgi:PIN domain nuclease of toxin-antitoxin system